MFKNILLPYDFENDFSSVPSYLEKIVGKGSTVTIYHVVTDNNFAMNLQDYIEHKNNIIREKEEMLSPFLHELDKKEIQYNVEIEFGVIKDTILEKINNDDVDLVIMSNHRVNLNIKHILGDVTHKIAKRSPVPVMIIK